MGSIVSAIQISLNSRKVNSILSCKFQIHDFNGRRESSFCENSTGERERERRKKLGFPAFFLTDYRWKHLSESLIERCFGITSTSSGSARFIKRPNKSSHWSLFVLYKVNFNAKDRAFLKRRVNLSRIIHSQSF